MMRILFVCLIGLLVLPLIPLFVLFVVGNLACEVFLFYKEEMETKVE